MKSSRCQSRWFAPLATLATLGTIGCGGDSDRSSGATPLSAPELGGAVQIDPHAGGRAAELNVAEVSFGRLVDLYDREPSSGAESLQYTDLVVDPALVSDGVDFALEPHAGRARLVVLHPASSANFALALERATGALPLVEPGSGPGAALAAVPRDAALSVRFDDLLDASSIGAETVLVEAGGAPLSVRVLPDPNRGGYADLDGDGQREFYTTRAIVDPVVSRLDQLRDGFELAAGWPASASAGEAHLELRLAAGPGRGASAIASATGVSLSRSRAGGEPVLAFRGGGPTALTGDARNGLLDGGGAPRVLSQQPLDVLSVQALGRRRFLLSYSFDVASCRLRPAAGDLIEFAGGIAEVLESDQAYSTAGSVFSNVPVFLLAGPGAAVAAGPALYEAPFDPARDLPECFVTFSPPASSPPVQGVSKDANVIVRFDRPMDPASFEALRTYSIERGWAAPALEEKVVGVISVAQTLASFAFVPSVPLSTVAPVSPAAYVIELDGSASGVLGADGTPLADALPPVTFQLDPNQPSLSSSGIVLEFDQVDEDGNGSPELRGQFLYDLAAESIRPRPVARFSAPVDASQPLVGVMVPLPTGIQTPLAPLGSKLMSVWRYSDMGFSLLDENYHNLDVEGLYWSPAGGQVVFDQFAQFQMTLGHAGFLPDEDVNTGLLPSFPLSGLSNTFDQNYLDPARATVVHPKAAGYTVSPLDLTSTVGGTPLMPWPVNRGVPAAQFTYWTYRDTGIQDVGAPNGVGADTRRMTSILGAMGSIQGLYRRDEVPTIGLPLLTEFRTYPDSGAVGLNSLKISIAINSSANPYFRTFSTGGVLSSGTPVVIDPDLEVTGSGGINPFNGQKTPSRDNAFYIGQADFVVRVSRAHTVWFDTGGTQSFGAAVLEPAASFQPQGTLVVLAFRGADDITSFVPAIWGTTQWIDPYGDSYDQAQINKLGGPGSQDESFSVSYLNGDSSWGGDLSDLAGARYVQARITMISDPETGATPTVSGLGLPFVN